MIKITNPPINTTNADIKSIKIEIVADANDCHLLVTYTAQIDGFEKRGQFGLYGQEFNDFWAVYNSDKVLIEMLAKRIGMTLDTAYQFENKEKVGE